MRNRICYTAVRRYILFAVALMLVFAIGIGIFCWMLTLEPAFFDANAKAGAPEGLAEERGYTSYVADGVCAVALCGNPEIDGKDVKLFLTSPPENEVFLRAEIYSVRFTFDAAGKVTAANPDQLLGKSGFLRPNEYVETITLDESLTEDITYVMIKIGTYVEETGTSNGFFYVNTALMK